MAVVDDIELLEQTRSLRNDIELLRSKNYGWGFENSFWMLFLTTISAIFAGIAAISATIPDIQKFYTTIPIAISGACYLILRQMKYSDRANAHYRLADELKCLIIELDWQTSRPIVREELVRIADQYKLIIMNNAVVFQLINNALASQASASQVHSTQHQNTPAPVEINALTPAPSLQQGQQHNNLGAGRARDRGGKEEPILNVD